MTTLSHLNFDDWITFLFDRPVTAREWYWDDDFEPGDLGVCLEYCERLFSAPRFLLDRFSHEQINQALWLLAGPRFDIGVTGWMGNFEPTRTRRVQAACYRRR